MITVTWTCRCQQIENFNFSNLSVYVCVSFQSKTRYVTFHNFLHTLVSKFSSLRKLNFHFNKIAIFLARSTERFVDREISMLGCSAMNASVIVECSLHSKSKWFTSYPILHPHEHNGDSVIPILCKYVRKRAWLISNLRIFLNSLDTLLFQLNFKSCGKILKIIIFQWPF